MEQYKDMRWSDESHFRSHHVGSHVRKRRLPDGDMVKGYTVVMFGRHILKATVWLGTLGSWFFMWTFILTRIQERQK